jgi:hypothetical protein
MGQVVSFNDVVTSAGGNALLVYEVGNGFGDTNLMARWGRRGRPFGPAVQLTEPGDPDSVAIDAIPGGQFAVRWIDRSGTLRLLRASAPGRPFREVARWTAPGSVDFRTLLPLADGRTLVAWATEDPNRVEPDRLIAAEIDPSGRIGPEQTIVVGANGQDLLGFALRRLGSNRAALVWTESGKGKKRVRAALAPR